MTTVVVRRLRVELISCAVAVLMMGLATAAHAQGQDDAFKKGLEARNDRKWAEAAGHMRRAIQADPKDDARKVRTGGFVGILTGRGTEYVPHFFLAEALFNQNDCVGAVESWATSEQQGAVRATEFFKILQAGYASCEMRGVLPPSRFDPLVTRTTQHITEVNAHAGRVTALGQAHLPLWRADVREQYERARNEIEAARSKLSSGTKNRTERDFSEANAAAERARSTLVGVESTLNAAIEAQRTFEGQARDVEQLISAADAIDRSIDARTVGLPPALASTRQEGRDALGLARSRLDSGKGTSNSAALVEARTLAQGASSRFTRVIDELTRIEKVGQDRLLADAVRGAQEAFAFIDGALATLDRLAAQRPTFMSANDVAEREAVQRQVTLARRRYESARRSESPAGVTDATRLTVDLRGRLSTLIATFGPVTLIDRGVHAAIVDGARLFLAGEYQQALAALNPPEGFAAEVPLQLHVHLFRAAAYYALFERSRATDQSLRAKALAEVEQCKQMNAAFQPDPRAFSPRFISFFQNGAASDARAPAPAASQP